MSELTPRQMSILRALRHSNGRTPSSRELAQAVGYAPSSYGDLAPHLRRLEYRGYIKRGPFKSGRTLTLTPTGLLAAQGFEVIYWEKLEVK